MISLDNDPTPLLGLTDVTCCPCHVCVYVCVPKCDSHDIGIAISYCFILHFRASNGKFVFSARLLLSVFTLA